MATRALRDLSITRKLTLITLAGSAVAVLLASSVFGVTDALQFRQGALAHVATLGDVIATNSTAAITFEDRPLAREVLASLRAETDILSARMYTADGRLLADYTAAAWSGHRPTEHIDALLSSVADSGQPAQRFEGLDHLLAVRPVYFDGELIGLLLLHTSLEGLAASLQRVVLTALLTVALAIFAAYLLSFRLQRVISQPILMLSRLMKRVTTEQDYSLRASPSSDDELGILMQGFNEMLQQISSRDLKLAEQQQALEAQNRNVADANKRLTLAMEESLQAKDAAESASRAKSDFLARMSHEIRTPMNGVLGMAELLLSSELGATERKFAETIQQSGEALLAIINDILDFSKIEAGRLELEDSRFDVAEVVESIVDLLYARAHGQGVELIAAIAPDLATTVRGDGVRLRQILMNLVGNAVKFTHAGEIVLAVTGEPGPDGADRYRFEVRDSGIGIEAEQQSLIFDHFSQADISTTRQYGGTGLGLAICKQLVQLMGGQIGVRSTPGDGSTFWFTLPLQRERDAPPPNSLVLGDVRVLVVDDNATNRELLVNQLAAWNIRPVAAGNATEALYLFEQACQERAPFDVLLLDFFMPDKDGLGLTREIRARHELPQPHVLMLSSARPGYKAQELRSAGVDVYLTKPVRRKPLFNALCFALAEGSTPASGERAATPARAADAVEATVLLVEDIPVNMQVAGLMLRSLGCRVIEAGNGREALAALERNAPDLVFMDCQMPVMDGFTATRCRREFESENGLPRVPIVALTANALSEDRQRCLDAGMDDFISKPFTRQALLDAVRQWRGAAAGSAGQPPERVERPAGSSLDPAALQQIAELDPENGAELVNEVIDTFLDNSQALLSRLRTAFGANDAEDARRAAHALKSSSGNVGGVGVAALCAGIERAAHRGRLDEIGGMLEQVVAEHAALAREIVQCKRGVPA